MIRRLLKRILVLAGFLASLVVTGVVVWAFSSRSLPDLKVWHRAELPSEFRAENIEDMTSIADYLAREDALFDEVARNVYSRVLVEDQLTFNRYYTRSAVHPENFAENFNRSFDRNSSAAPVCGVLLVHGLTDSPYSMRHLAELFAEKGCYALVLRMPGHGTIPASLTRIGVEDWHAAVALGVAAVRKRIGEDQPLFLAGYSNGGALVLHYALLALDNSGFERISAVYLFSPMVGVTPFSRFAAWGETLSRLDYFEKFKWLDVQPEYDPFKYNSFPKAAGHATFLITQRLRSRLGKLAETNQLADLPPVMAFQSLVDATVSTPAVVNLLFARLSGEANELVLFDLNRASDIAPFLAKDDVGFVETLLTGPPLPYDLTLVGNVSTATRDVASRRRVPGMEAVTKTNLGVAWPQGVYSLSHVALVFPPQDELYGVAEASRAAGLPLLGALNPRGERGVTSVSLAQLMRLRHNPFYDYMAGRLRDSITYHLMQAPESGR